MPDHDDFHAFQSTIGDTVGSVGCGCFSDFFKWIVIGFVVLYIIGKLEG